MGNLRIEVCLISARGLRRTSSLWKLQWFAVGWIDPNNKYCTRIDTSGNANPLWKTKFATLLDDSNFQDAALQIEVYSREPIFLRERLEGTATVALKEFLAKHSDKSEASRPKTEEVGSYQLRRKNSNKPQGFVDVSVRIFEEKEEPSTYPGKEGGFVLMDHSDKITLPDEAVSGNAYPGGAMQQLQPPFRPHGHQPQISSPYMHPLPYPMSYPTTSVAGPSYQPAVGPSYLPPRTLPPPPPPSNAGYIPTLIPRVELGGGAYVNLPSSAAAPGRGLRPGVGVGVGAGALAAGALIYGDEFMSGFDVPAGLQDASLTISTDPLF